MHPWVTQYDAGMDDYLIDRVPQALPAIEAEARDAGFGMASDRRAGALLRVLAASRPQGRFLELGTGCGLSAAWLLDGMDSGATLIPVDVEETVGRIAGRHLGQDRRLTLVVAGAQAWLRSFRGAPFDLIFADAMPGKYQHFDLAWGALSKGGIYVIDDMLPQDNWPEGHAGQVEKLLRDLDSRTDCRLVRLSWSSGVVLAVRT